MQKLINALLVSPHAVHTQCSHGFRYARVKTVESTTGTGQAARSRSNYNSIILFFGLTGISGGLSSSCVP